MIKSLLSGLTIGTVGTLLAMQYHLVRTNERFVIVARVHQPPLRSAYVDIRHWSSAMWEHYPELQEAMVKSGRQDLMAESKPVEKAPAHDTAVPFHDVSKSSETPIFNASEARLPIGSSKQVSAAAKEVPKIISTPQIALGSAQPSASSNSSLKPDRAIITSAKGISESFPSSLQRTVPNPVEMQPASPIATTIIKSDLQPKPEMTAAPQKHDWMQNLLKNIVPTATPPKQNAAISEPASAAEPTPSQAIPSSQGIRQEETIDPQGEISFPASPRRIPVAQSLEH